LHALAGTTARVIVASSAGLLPRVSAPNRLLNASIDLRPGQEISPADLGALLVDAGFTREDPADEHGEFAVRGGIVDIYPAGEAQPVRIEYIGDTIESLRTYDPATQRSVHAIDQIEIVPLRDILVVGSQQDHSDHPESTGDRSDRSATLFDYLARAKESRIILSESDEVEAHLVTLSEQIQNSYEDVAGGTGVASPAELFADWGDLQARIAHATNHTQLGLDDDAPVAPGLVAGVPSSAGPRTTPAPLNALPPPRSMSAERRDARPRGRLGR
jgi:transcription-repair coupling factor (superfamily II helicase)